MGPKVNYNEHPEGDMAVAAKYMKLAGYPGGKYTGSQTLQVVGSTGEPQEAMAQVTNQTLLNLGFKTHLTLVDQSVMYSKYCTVPSQEIDVCPNAGWVRDFADPQTVLYVPFYGPAITPAATPTGARSTTPRSTPRWKRRRWWWANRRAPTRGRRSTKCSSARRSPRPISIRPAQIEGKNVAGVNQLWNTGAWDYAFTSLK